MLCEPDVMAGGHGQAGHHGAHTDSICPYAHSAGSAPLRLLPVLASGAALDLLVPWISATQTLLPFGPPRQLTSRGPPQFL
jgi:hypothetical protein